MSVLQCAEVWPHLESLRRDDCSRELALLLEEHLARCPECRRQLAHLTQVTAMLAAWRPRRAPRGLKLEIAATVGDTVEAEARALYGPAPFLRPGRIQLPRLSSWQRAVNILAIVALAFLAGVIIFEVLYLELSDAPPGAAGTKADTAGQATATGYDVTLLDAGPRKIAVATLIGRVSDLDLREAAQAADTPGVVIKLRPAATRAAAEAIAREFGALGSRAEVREPM